MQVYVPSWKELRQRNVVMQTYDYSCGAAALATILRYYWNDPVDERQIVNMILKTLTADEVKDRMKHGLAISDLRRAAVRDGLPLDHRHHDLRSSLPRPASPWSCP